MIKFIGIIGYWFNSFLLYIIKIFSVVALFIRYLPLSFSSKFRYRYIFFESFLNAIYQTGIRTLYVTSVISILFGIFLSLQIIDYVNINENNLQLFIHMLIIFIIREIGPLVSGIILILRASSYICVRLSLMSVRKEDEVIMSLGINPIIFILTPILLAFPLSLFAIIFYFDFLSISTSYFMLYIQNSTIEFNSFWKTLFLKIGYLEIVLTLLKAFIGGIFIGAITIYFSQTTKERLSMVANSVSNAVTSSTIVFIVIDFAISIIGY